MKDVSEQAILDAVSLVDLKKPETIDQAVSSLTEGNVKTGATVAVIDDPTYAYPGCKGKVKGVSAKGGGFVDVEFADGTIVPLQSSLLIPL